MPGHINSQQFVRIAAVGFAVFAAVVAVIHSRRGEDPGFVAPLEREQADLLATELARSRSITPDETVALGRCRRAWAENRQHFFVPAKPTGTPSEQIPRAAIGPAKNQDRVTPVETESETR